MSDDKTPAAPAPKEEAKDTELKDRKEPEELTEEQLEKLSGGKKSHYL